MGSGFCSIFHVHIQNNLEPKQFKALNPELDKDITLYAFRHSGAIEIFKRTGSLHKMFYQYQYNFH